MMKKIAFFISLLSVGLLVSLASGEEVRSLRKADIAGGDDPSVDMDWKPMPTAAARTFVHQPPVIPHDVSGLAITMEKNDCLNCHGVEGSNAPKPHASHYLDWDSKLTEKISSRWHFCTQCHVGQVDAQPLVENVFDAKAEK